jgi:CheY-like chemotaxis protein
MMPTSAEFTYLVVEDDEPKLNAIVSAVLEADPIAKIHTCGSVASAVNLISKERVDIAVLDMSLPAFDLATDLGDAGRPQDFGGQDILRFLEDTQENTRSVIITQYEEFASDSFLSGSRSLSAISKELESEFPNTLIAVLYYSGRRGPWREKIRNIIFEMKGSEIG